MNSGSASPNPWQDSEALVKQKPPEASEAINLTIDGLESQVKEKEEKQVEPTPKPDQQILDEFDPLASQEESAARKAWEESEGHPPPPSTPPPVPSKDDHEKRNDDELEGKVRSSSSSAQEDGEQSSTLGNTFPSLAALARSFSISSLPGRPARPVSIDSAKPVPSPATLSSFAQQQGDATGSVETTPDRRKEKQREDQIGDDTLKGNEQETATKQKQAQTQQESAEPPFDFQKFLDQMKTRSADPVSKYLKSFLSNFSKRTFTTADQIKIINDFLGFIARQMRECDVWKSASDAEFDNAMEGMEKLVMNQLYQFTFTPAIAQSIPRRQVTTDDLERDRVLQQRIALFGWLEEKHLDVPEGEGSKGFLMFAQQELLKINHYKAPRDKLICILNCCKVIFGLIRHLQKEEGADSFVPILIFVVLKANPDHLLSNVEFINRFRNPEKLQSEAGYYLSSLMGAVSFIETMDHTSLSCITQEEFERNVEEAIQDLPPSEKSSPYLPGSVQPPPRISSLASSVSSTSSSSSHAGEESAHLLSLSTPAPPPHGSQSPAQMISEDAKRLFQKTGDTISKPLNAISRIFNEALDSLEGSTSNPPPDHRTPNAGSGRFVSYLPGPFAPFELGKESKGGNNPFPIPPWAHPDERYQAVSLPGSRSASPGIPQTPLNAEGYPGSLPPPIQTPYKPRVRKALHSSRSPVSGSWPGSPTSPGYSVEDTPTRPAGGAGPYTNSPLAIGPSQPYFGFGEGISRTPTPAFDLPAVQAHIDSAHEQEAIAARETLVQIFPAMDQEILDLVLEANNGDLGKSIESLLEMSVGD